EEGALGRIVALVRDLDLDGLLRLEDRSRGRVVGEEIQLAAHLGHLVVPADALDEHDDGFTVAIPERELGRRRVCELGSASGELFENLREIEARRDPVREVEKSL